MIKAIRLLETKGESNHQTSKSKLILKALKETRAL